MYLKPKCYHDSLAQWLTIGFHKVVMCSIPSAVRPFVEDATEFSEEE